MVDRGWCHSGLTDNVNVAVAGCVVDIDVSKNGESVGGLGLCLRARPCIQMLEKCQL
jgi:hypothetical protein